MKIAKMSLWLSVIAALLVVVASVSGLIFKSTYARETPDWALQGVGQDIVNLVAVVVLLIALYFVSKGSIKAYLIWSGVLLYLLYAYVIYAFDIHFNRLFLVYVAILGLTFYALVSSVIHIRLAELQETFAARTPTRLVSGFLLVLCLLFYFLWLGEEIPALITGSVPTSLALDGVLTNPVHILDLAFYLPAILLTALLLWRKKPLGYLLAGPLLVFIILMGAAILAIFLVMSSQGLPTSIGVEVLFALLIIASLTLSVIYINSVKA
ncbi:hypothetical protein KDA_42810 [Dictyobacter alpinus]|uniref:Uncharacterized protein n=1 Tax=Dictyobacter alpinus TaxID=2014873 RepID=A0A402BBZ8_9CHLR|nr:hypothetical protein [Dictyobacter alpinus]GCE28797.1 hypothetical protein KDA_42810 [Dictyobacter alpinus]